MGLAWTSAPSTRMVTPCAPANRLRHELETASEPVDARSLRFGPVIAGTLTATVFVLGVATSATPQEKPDFSGEWVLNRPASTLSPGSDGVQSGIVRIEHREPMFRYKATLVSATPFEYHMS